MKKLLPLSVVCNMFLAGCTLPRRDAPRGWIYILVNGQLASAPQTTRFRTVPVLTKSFAAIPLEPRTRQATLISSS